MPGLEHIRRKPTAEEFMQSVAMSRGQWPIDASNAAHFFKGIVYMVIEHDLRPPELGARFPAGEKIIPRQNEAG